MAFQHGKKPPWVLCDPSYASCAYSIVPPLLGLALYTVPPLLAQPEEAMDRGFKDELRAKLGPSSMMLPRLFVRGRHVEDVLRLDEEGLLVPLLEGLPRARGGECDGCGGISFLPCFHCSGSRKLAVTLPVVVASCRRRKKAVVMRCGECNENGLVLCPICS